MGALPTEERARAMKDRDYLWCALNLLLDQEEELELLCPACRSRALSGCCPVCGAPAGSGSSNETFDWARYRRLKGEET